MRSSFFLAGLVIIFGIFAVAQQDASQNSNNDRGSGANPSPPRSDAQTAGAQNAEGKQSSSRETRIDISPPPNDVKDHPLSAGAVAGKDKDDKTEDSDAGDVQEMKPFNPYRANNDVDVGDYYFKLKNYKGALARYQDALAYKDNDALANFRMAQCYEKLNQPGEAIAHYREYLKILPNGQYAKDARKALQKLGASEAESATKPPQP